MILPIILGVAFVIRGGYFFKKYLSYKKGLHIMGVISAAKYKQVNIRRKMDVVEISYSYEINGVKYSKTEISEQHKHLFKSHSLKGERIRLTVPKNSPKKATCNAVGSYLSFALALIFLGTIAITVGLISKPESAF